MARTYGNFTDFIDFSRASSGTYLGSDGLLKTAADNVPRIEYDANGNEIGLLIEEQRTNLIPESNSLTIAMGRVEGSPVSSPDGSNDGNEYRVSGSSGSIYIYPNSMSVTSGVDYTFSTWVRRTTKTPNVGCDFVKISSQANIASAEVVFDLVSGSAVGTPTMPSYSIEAFPNGWYRIKATNTAVATSGSGFSFILWPSKNALGDAPDIVLDGISIGDYVFDVWGAQLEQGSFATSYIPTSGATATRSADIADIATANFGYNPKAGTVVVDFDNLKFEAGGSRYPRPFELGSASHAGERINVYVGESTQNLAFGINTANAAQAGATLLAGVSSPVGPYKISVAFKKNDVAAVETGGGVLTDTSADISGVVYPRNTLQIGGSAIGTTNQVNGHIKSIKYIPRRNSNTQLQEFTS